MARIFIENYWRYGNGKGVMLMPAKSSYAVRIELAFDGDGRWDVDDFLGVLESALRREMGLGLDLRTVADRDPSFLEMIKHGIVTDCVHTVDYILAEFSLDERWAERDGDPASLRLVMKESGRRLDVRCGPADDGGLDSESLLQNLAECN